MEFYDVGSSDLRELWESYLIEPTLGGDVLSMNKDDEWCGILSSRDKSLSVVLRDRLMTDAALGGPRPIKSEHSYSLLTASPPRSPATPGDNPHTPNSGSMSIQSNEELHGTSLHGQKVINLRSRIDDMEEECFPAISMNTASGRVSSPPPENMPINLSTMAFLSSNRHEEDEHNDSIEIKGEPISAPNSPAVSLPNNLIDDKSTIHSISPHRLHFGNSRVLPTSDSEEDDEEYYQRIEMEIDPENIEKTESNRGNRQNLPPTPPSSASSDSEGAASCSPERRDSHSSNNVQNLRGYLGQRIYINSGNSTRQPIHTSLISCQPKGSTGILTLTEEEKRTLIAEGYPVPTKLPLTKQEEKSLKKVRRKIKNKISAQESRRKKKEYMDGLERRVTMLTNENSSYRDRLTTLEDTNKQLLKELRRLQALVEGQS